MRQKDKKDLLIPSNHISPEIFEQQMEYLSRKKNVIFMSELAEELIKGNSIRNNSVILTFDDGYLDNYLVAAPILKKYNLKATIFLPTGYISRTEIQWIDEIYSVVNKRNNNNIEYQGVSYNLEETEDFYSFYNAVCNDLITVDCYNTRRKILDDITIKLDSKIQLPQLTMSWEDVNKMLSEYSNIEIGGHTVDHLDLSNICISDIKKEINDSWTKIREYTNKEPLLFSCPYGRNSEDIINTLSKESQYCASIGDCNFNVTVNRTTDIWDIKRVESKKIGLRFRIDCCNYNTGIWRNLTNKRN